MAKAKVVMEFDVSETDPDNVKTTIEYTLSVEYDEKTLLSNTDYAALSTAVFLNREFEEHGFSRIMGATSREAYN